MYDRAVERESYALCYVPDQYKTQVIHERAIERVSYVLKWFLISIRPKRCVKELLKHSMVIALYFLGKFAPDQYKTQDMCNDRSHEKNPS